MTGADSHEEPAEIRILSQNITPEEVAAVTAVVRAAFLEAPAAVVPQLQRKDFA